MNTLWKYKLWIGGGFFLVVIGLIVGATRPKHTSGAQPGASPDVEVVQVGQKNVPIFGEWIGTLDGFTNADVRAQVTGYLLRRATRKAQQPETHRDDERGQAHADIAARWGALRSGTPTSD